MPFFNFQAGTTSHFEGYSKRKKGSKISTEVIKMDRNKQKDLNNHGFGKKNGYRDIEY